MRKVGVYLIYASVVLRGLVRLANEPEFGLAALLLASYGLLLVLAESRVVQRGPWRFAPAEQPSPAMGAAGKALSGERWLPLAYLLVQSGLVAGLLLVPPILDFFGLLFVPLGLQAVFFFGRRLGFLCIGLFFVAMAGPMLIDEKGWVFGLTMTVLNIGYCLLFSGYAHQVQKAESTRSQTRRLLGELQLANRQLQGYTTQMEELAAEQERSRLARELHDSVTQTVFGMNLAVQSARLLLERDPGRVAGQLERLEELAGSATTEIQSLVSQLRPRPGAGEGLPASLHRLAAERQARDGLDVTLEVHGERVLTEMVTTGLYRIAQEALTNVSKHAAAQQAAVRLHLGGDSGLLEIEDRGPGFDPQVALSQRDHLGLASMAERAREIGWSLSIESRPGGGTRIQVQENPPGGTA
jgi:signal transduction histidine kinase